MNLRKTIQGCENKDPYYQRELVVHFSPVLMTVSRRYTRDDAMAKDVLQEALLKILRDIGQYSGSGNFEGWMRKIVVRTALNYCDKSMFKNELLSLEQQAEKVVYHNILDELEAEDLMKVINQLPDGYREVINLYGIEGYSHKEIAELLDISESTSRSQLTRARKQLQQLLARQKKIDYESFL